MTLLDDTWWSLKYTRSLTKTRMFYIIMLVSLKNTILAYLKVGKKRSRKAKDRDTCCTDTRAHQKMYTNCVPRTYCVLHGDTYSDRHAILQHFTYSLSAMAESLTKFSTWSNLFHMYKYRNVNKYVNKYCYCLNNDKYTII